MTLLIVGHEFAYEMENVLRVFYPGQKLEIQTGGEADDADLVATRRAPLPNGYHLVIVQVRIGGFDDTLVASLDPGAPESEAELIMAGMLYRLLCKQSGYTPAWGMLTGVRPVSLCRSMAAQGLNNEAVRARLQREYYVSDAKAALVLETLQNEEPLLRSAYADGFSLYISIPFCPSRCLYCSFVSHDIEGVRKLVPEYVRLLCEELRATGELARRLGLRLQTVYIGGGTPTALAAEQLKQIMQAVRDHFDLAHLMEYTVEAGRPDTVTPEKLAVLKAQGATRVSINPQTMNDEILRAIGRGHTAADIRRAFAQAREAGFDCINMDLIAGLPGESAGSFADTLRQVLELGPENITVHTLTVKRSSQLRESDDAFSASPLDVSALLDSAHTALTGAGLRPYYLYRQKGTLQNLENTGYAKPGSEGLYNALIMEEVQTILAVGAGAVTKLCKGGKPVKRIYNYKFPYEYNASFEEILHRKTQAEQLLKELLP